MHPLANIISISKAILITRIISSVGSGAKQFRIIRRDEHRGLVICWGDYKVTISSVDNVQLLSSIIPDDGTIINETIL